jgi:D-alanyl-lipoteichoic acid acyltransferase DltB (MBOAT superfamily)
MLFHSQVFLLAFLPLTLGVYYLLAAHHKARIWILIIASLGFYGYWDLRFLPLLVGSISANWLLAKAYQRCRFGGLVFIGVGFNLILIGLFKYADFLVDSLAAPFNWSHDPWNIILPLGISFFTFQQISYLVDLNREKAPSYSFADYALYVTFFPQLIAGPIVRHNEIIHQFQLSPRREGMHERLSRGCTLLLIGLFKKVILADNLAAISDSLFGAAAEGTALSFGESWLAAGAFGLQIYFDFSGYSDMALGLGLLFGFSLPVNFNAPYVATSVRDFWRRWHMTLSRFLRDYLYIPLGGSRFGLARQGLALSLTMLLGGLWHGAAWTFVAWGGLHGLALAVNHAWRKTGIALPSALGWVLTMLFVFSAWVLFRAQSFGVALDMLATMAGLNGWELSAHGSQFLWLIALAGAFAVFGPTSQRVALDMLMPRRAVAWGLSCALVFMALQVGGGDNAEFIYFQF